MFLGWRRGGERERCAEQVARSALQLWGHLPWGHQNAFARVHQPLQLASNKLCCVPRELATRVPQSFRGTALYHALYCSRKGTLTQMRLLLTGRLVVCVRLCNVCFNIIKSKVRVSVLNTFIIGWFNDVLLYTLFLKFASIYSIYTSKLMYCTIVILFLVYFTRMHTNCTY